MERGESHVTSTELAFELLNDFYKRVGGRVDISASIGYLKYLSGGYQIKLLRKDPLMSLVEAATPDGPIKLSFNKRGLLGASIYGTRPVWREFLSTSGKKAEFGALSIPLILWTFDCFLQDRLEPIPEGVLKTIDKLSKDRGLDILG